MLELTQAETITRTIIVLSCLAGLCWGVTGLKLNIAREATLYFFCANFCIAFSYAIALFSASGPNLVNYFQTFNWTDVLLLGATMLIHSGLRKLHGVVANQTRAQLAVVLALAVLIPCGYLFRLLHVVAIVVLLASVWYAFSAFADCHRALRKHFTRSTSLMLIWPLAAAGILFFLRVVDVSVTMLQATGQIAANNMDQNVKIQFLVAFIWVGLLITTLLNASLIGLTLNNLFKNLNDQANRLQHILDTAPVGVSISLGGKVRFANTCATKMLDLEVDDDSSAVLVHAEDRDKIIRQLKSRGAVHNMEIQMFNPQKSVRDILVTYLASNFGGETGILGWMLDITERKQADRATRQTSEEQNAIFDSATLGIAFIRDNVVIRANHRLESLFGQNSGSLRGQSAQHLWRSTAGSANPPCLDIERGAIHQSTQKLKRKGGSQFWCRISGSPIDANDLSKGSVWMFDDVTVERNAVHMISQARAMAEDLPTHDLPQRLALLETILSALGKGTLPRSRTQQPTHAPDRQPPRPAPPEAALLGASLLLVEDHLPNQELVLSILQQNGVRVDVAENAAQALAMVQQTVYDGVLMACGSKAIDGIATTRQIRAESRFATLPVLALGGERETALAAGMNAHVSQPVEAAQLFLALSGCIKPGSPYLDDSNTPAGADEAVTGSGGLAAEADLPQVPGLDVAQAMRRMRGNTKLMHKLIGRFVATGADAPRRIQSAIENNDLPGAIRDTQALKGLAGNIGATRLQACAGTLELALQQGEAGRPALDALEALEQELLPLITALSDTNPVADPPPQS